MTSAGLQGPQYVKLQFSRHHRQLRSRYELSLGMHLRDQIALGVTPSKSAALDGIPVDADRGCSAIKHFGRNWNIFLEQISRCGCYHIGLIWQTLKFSLQMTRVPAVHADGKWFTKELDSDDVPDGRFDILLCRDSSREVGE
nr:BBF_HP1_G0028160.mRNA.1.CDS.1 [Saccharomyces cerevisiae]